MNLVAVELTRFFTRRAVVLLLVAGVVLAAIMVATTAYGTRPVSKAEMDAARQAFAEQRQQAEGDYQRCLVSPTEFFGDGGDSASCEEILPKLEWFLERAPLNIRNELNGSGIALLVLLGGLALVVGATFAGADWACGSMSNQLLFEPRRLRVWTAKGVAVAVGTAVGVFAALAVFWTGLLAVSLVRDLTVPTAVWQHVLAVSGRGLALVTAGAVGAFALTMLLRHTVGTLGLLFASVLASEAVAATLPVDKMSQWSLANNFMAWFHNGWTVQDESICHSDGCSGSYVLGLGHSATYLGFLLLLSVVASLVAFRRRDLP